MEEINTRQTGLNRRQLKLLVGGIIVAAIIGYLIWVAARGSVAYYMTVDEVRKQGPMARNVRVAGQVVGSSIVWTARDLRLEFEIADESGQLPVVYNGSRPDMFRDQADVVLEGRLGPKGVFEARTMLLKCPSKYEEG
jgi:cytochrome c-type biogenesis protein CcmE